MRFLRRLVWVAIVASVAGLVWPFVRPELERARFMYSLWQDQPADHLPLPVETPRPPRLVDSWGAIRPGGRRHEGIDIFAPKDSPVLSTTRGVVVEVGTNRLGGNVVEVLGPGLEVHYYAHLDAYGAFKVGDIVAPGDVIGYVGNTGDARGGPFHLHYGIYSRTGTAEDPYPRLETRRARVARSHSS